MTGKRAVGPGSAGAQQGPPAARVGTLWLWSGAALACGVFGLLCFFLQASGMAGFGLGLAVAAAGAGLVGRRGSDGQGGDAGPAPRGHHLPDPPAEPRVEHLLESFGRVAGHAFEAMLIVDSDGRIVDANRRAGGLFHIPVSELVGTAMCALDWGYDEELHQELSARAMERGVDLRTHTQLMPDGEVLRWEIRVARLAAGEQSFLLFVVRDVSERERLEAKLLLADRMVAVGTLAAGVAHEINNPLTSLMLHLELIERKLRAMTPVAEGGDLASLLRGLQRVRDGAERVGVIVRDLKTFSRGDGDVRDAVDLRGVVKSTLALAYGQLSHRAVTTLEFEGHCTAFANPTRLSQVVLNLALNAVHAFGDRPVRENHIEVRVRSTPDEVVLEVADNGPGMTEEVAGQVFEPFFSTKPAGVGTGLGLFVCRTLVEELGGRIELVTAPGQGARFRVHLPSAQGLVVPGLPSTRSVLQGSFPPPRAELSNAPRILIIDDEPGSAHSLKTLLNGYEVVVACDVKQARARLRDSEPFDLVLCDFGLHARSDGETYRAARDSHPPMARRWVFMTGSEGCNEVSVPANDVLQKPVRGEALWDLLREGVA